MGTMKVYTDLQKNHLYRYYFQYFPSHSFSQLLSTNGSIRGAPAGNIIRRSGSGKVVWHSLWHETHHQRRVYMIRRPLVRAKISPMTKFMLSTLWGWWGWRCWGSRLSLLIVCSISLMWWGWRWWGGTLLLSTICELCSPVWQGWLCWGGRFCCSVFIMM